MHQNNSVSLAICAPPEKWMTFARLEWQNSGCKLVKKLLKRLQSRCYSVQYVSLRQLNVSNILYAIATHHRI